MQACGIHLRVSFQRCDLGSLTYCATFRTVLVQYVSDGFGESEDMWFLRGGLGRGSFVVFYVGLVVLPLLIAGFGADSGAGFRTDLGSGLGIAAFAMLLAGFWLTGRFQVISARAGLDLILTFHRYAAVGAIALLIAHVVVVATADIGGPSPAAWMAFVLVLIIGGMSVARSRIGLRFETWRYTHGIGAMVVAIAGFSHATSDGLYSSSGPLQAFWAAMVVLAIGSLVWVHAVRPARKAKHPYDVVSVTKAADHTWTVALQPRHGDAVDFIAGQYAFVSFGERGYRKPGNPFSFSSAPSQRPRIEFTIKENGDLTDTISQLEVGSVAYIHAPLGHLAPGNMRGSNTAIDSVVLIAGGIGITPMISILRQAAHRGQKQPIELLYGARSAGDLAFVDEIDELKATLNLNVHYVVADTPAGWTHDMGRLDKAFLSRHLDTTNKDSMFFVCGGTGLIDSVLRDLDRLDVATPGQVHSENFAIYD